MSTLVLAPTELEFRAVHARLAGRPFAIAASRVVGEQPELHLSVKDGAPTLFYARLGLGKLPSAVAAAHLVERLGDGLDRIILCGVAGGVDPSLRAGDTVIGTSALHLDIGHQTGEALVLAAPGEFPSAAPRHSEPAHDCDPAALMLLDSPTSNGQRIVAGRLATTDRFIADGAYVASIHRRFGVSAIDMESASIGYVAEAAGLKWAVIRTITDGADDDAMADFMRRLEHCAGIAADLAVRLARHWVD